MNQFLSIHYYAYYGDVDKCSYYFDYFQSGIHPKQQEIGLALGRNHDTLMGLCLQHGCRFYLLFAKYIYSLDLSGTLLVRGYWLRKIKSSICLCFVMNDIFDIEYINEPRGDRLCFNIGFPKCPSIETITKLLSKHVRSSFSELSLMYNLKLADFIDDIHIKHWNLSYQKSQFLTIDRNHDRPKVNFTNRDLFECLGGNFEGKFLNESEKMDNEDLNMASAKYKNLKKIISNKSFEITFLNNTLNNNSFLTDLRYVDRQKILHDTHYATVVFNSTKDFALRTLCVTRFTSIGHLNTELILKYPPIKLYTEFPLSDGYFLKLVNLLLTENIPSLRIPLLKALVFHRKKAFFEKLTGTNNFSLCFSFLQDSFNIEELV